MEQRYFSGIWKLLGCLMILCAVMVIAPKAHAANISLHVWLADSAMGDTPDRYLVRDDLYLCYELIESGTGTPMDQLGDWDYTVVMTLDKPDGSTGATKTLYTDEGSMSLMPYEAGVYSGTVSVTGDLDITCDVDCNVEYDGRVSVSQSSVYLHLNGTNSVPVTYSVSGAIPGKYGVRYQIEDTSIVSAQWGGWTDYTTPLTLTGKKYGTTNVTVTLYENYTEDKNALHSVTIPVTVDADRYTFSYNANGGSGAPSSQTKIYGTALPLSTTVPTRFPYTFLGWSTSSTATAISYYPGDSCSSNYSRTFYAVWSAAEVYDAGTSYTADVEFPDQERYYSFVPSVSGRYAFESAGSLDSRIYVYESDGTQIGYDDDSSEAGTNFLLEVPLTAGNTYYIKIRAYSTYTGTTTFMAERLQYTLSYSANGGSGAPSSQSGDATYTVSNMVPSRLGYTFLGWSTSSTAATVQYGAGDTITLTGDTTLYAVWKQGPAVLSNVTRSTEIEFAKQEQFFTFTPSSTDYYIFESFGSLDTKGYLYDASGTQLAVNDDGGDSYNFRIQLKLQANTKYYLMICGYGTKTGSLQFQIAPADHTLTYDANGGTGAPDSRTGVAEYTICSTVPTRIGYAFLGWAKNSGASSPSYHANDTIVLEEDTTLYAVWQLIATPLTANSSVDATVSTGGQTLYFSFKPTQSASYVIWSAATKDTKVYLYDDQGNQLDMDDDDGEGLNFRLQYALTAGQTYIYSVQYYSSSNTGTIPVRFGRVYTVRYDANGGTGAPEMQIKDHGDTLTLSTTEPTRSGATFLGWATSSSATTAAYGPGDDFDVEADTVLYAVWGHVHSYTSRVTTAATCTTAGVRTYTCGSCGHSYTDTVAALGHDYRYETVSEPTCTAEGVITQTCTRCGHSMDQITSAFGHDWQAATCTQKATCANCGLTNGTALGHDYTDRVTKAATCTVDGVRTYTCDRCDHSYTEPIAATGHDWQAATCTAKKTCKTCAATQGTALGHDYSHRVTKAATCTANGVRTYTCGRCDHSYTEQIPATGHDWNAASCTSKRTCKTCGTADGVALGHDYTDRVTKAATCTANGVRTYTCDRCDHSYTEQIPATGHDWQAATCTAKKTCKTCAATQGTALGHDYTDRVTKAATCTANGVRTYDCGRCDHSYTEQIPATGHDWQAATCTAKKTCKTCAATQGVALGHDYTDRVTKAATCTASGVRTYTCDRCDHSYTEQIPATGHDWQAATCTAKKTCKTCGTTDGVALGHTYTDRVTKAATCTGAGVRTYQCDRCDHAYTEPVAAVGHDMGDWVDLEPTCTTAGSQIRNCSRCDHSEVRTVEATGHDMSGWMTVKKATCTENGEQRDTCASCGYYESKTIKATGHSHTSKITKQASCAEDGVKTFSCKCGDSYTERLPKLGHKFASEYTVDKEATCLSSGAKSRHCTRKGCDARTGVVAVFTAKHDSKTTTTKATLTKNGKVVTACTLCGKVERSVKVYKPAEIKLSTTKYTYSGQSRMPGVSVKDAQGKTLKKGTDYTVTYEGGRKEIGRYWVKITFRGKYSGTKTLYFTILPKATSKISVSGTATSLKATWKKVSGADGYRVVLKNASGKTVKSVYTTKLSYSFTGLSKGTGYKICVNAYKYLDGTRYLSSASKTVSTATEPAVPTLKVTSSAKGKATFRWSDVSGETGYQVYWSTSKNGTFKKLITFKAGATSGSKTGLTSGKTCYFKIRAYKKVGDTYVYGDWSSVKSVKIK